MVNVYKSIIVCFVCFPQIKVAPGSRNSAWVSFDGRNRQEIKQGDRYEPLINCIYPSDCYDCTKRIFHSHIKYTGKCASCTLHNVSFDFADFLLLCSVVITMSEWAVPCVNNTGHVTDWFDSLAECLHWNQRKEQKKFNP